MPPRAPIHTTSQPAARICSATASPGKMWPPVPPAMMRMVLTRSILSRAGGSPSRCAAGARDEPGEERDDERHAGEAELLGDHREQEVGVRLRQVEELLHARAEADAQPLATSEGD